MALDINGIINFIQTENLTCDISTPTHMFDVCEILKELKYEIESLTGSSSGGGGTSGTFSDGTFQIYDDIDPTKTFKFQASSISTNTNRTIIVPDKDITIADDKEIVLYINFLDTNPYIFNVPQTLTFTTQISEGTSASLTYPLSTSLTAYTKLTITPSSGGRPIYPPPPHPSVTAWTPPSDWIDISTVNDNEILLLVSDQSAGYAFAVTTVSGTYSIDWGDDTIEIGRTSGTTYSHEYVLGGGTPCSLGYTTYKIRIYDASSNITSFGVKKSIYGVSGGLQYQQHSYLWANFGTAYITSYANAFFITSVVNCPNLQAVKIISLQNCTSTAYMFNNCYALQSITLPTSWGSVTNTSAMFYNCGLLQSITLPTSWGSITSTSQMFYNCYSLQSITLPSISWENVTNTSSMFNNCYSLQSITLPTSWGNITSTYQMFYNCYSLVYVSPTTSWGSVNNTSYMFYNCYSLGSITLPTSYSASTIINASNMFYYTSLRKITNIEYLGSTANDCNFTDLIYGLESLKQNITMNTRLSSLGIYGGNTTTRVPITGLRLPNQGSTFSGASPQITVSYTNLNKNALELLFDDLPPFTTAKGINITGVSGVDTAISKTSCGTTNGSTTVTISNTSSLSAGMEITGTGISSAVAVTLTDCGDLVTRTAHGLSNGYLVSCATMTSTTGIAIDKPYYVINITPDTFQLSLTNGGAVIPLTTNGSGTILYQTKIVSINNNVSIIINKPASATGSVTLAFTLLQRSKATMKNWTITG